MFAVRLWSKGMTPSPSVMPKLIVCCRGLKEREAVSRGPGLSEPRTTRRESIIGNFPVCRI